MFIHKEQSKTKREIGFFGLVILGLGSMIGSGVFVLLAPGAEIAGKLLPLSYFLAGLLALLIAAVYAEFATAMPTSGASLTLFFEAYGLGSFSFVISWLLVLGDISYGAINALGFGYYASLFLPFSPIAIALVVLVIIALLNLRGVRQAISVENMVGALLVLSLTALVILSFVGADLSPASYFKELDWPDQGMFWAFLPVLSAVAIVFTSFIGVEDVSAMAGEVKEPAKVLPRALFTTVAIAVSIFVLLSFAALGIVGSGELAASDAPLFLLGESLGSVAEFVVFAAVFLATSTSLMTMVMVSSRKLFAVAEEGFFGKFLQKMNKAQVPSRCLLVAVIVMALLILTDSAEFVAYLGNGLYFISIILISYAVIKMRKKRPYMERPYRVPLFPWIPLAVIGLAGFILFFVSLQALLATCAWALIGFLFYLGSWIDTDRLKWMGLGLSILLVIIISISLLFVGFIW